MAASEAPPRDPHRPGFRTEFARRFIEPNYERVDLNVVKIRNLFAEFSRLAQEYGELAITDVGCDPSKPANPHLANTHHTEFLKCLDQSKDAYMKWLLACTSEMAPTECVVRDERAARLFEASAKRKRSM